MAKAKREVLKTDKTKLNTKVIKKRTAKKSGALTPKLKKLQVLQVIDVVNQDKIPTNSKPVKQRKSIPTSTPSLPKPEITLRKSYVLAPKSPVDKEQVRNGVTALYQYIEITKTKKTDLFDDENVVFLQITCIKVPNTPNRQVRYTLKHSLLTDDSEVCLIVKDIGKAKDHEQTIEHFEELLKVKGITNIKTIMPYHQFKTEYCTQYELKRKLLGLYDYFLVDGSISGYINQKLGKIFLEKRKMPVPIRLEEPNLKHHFETALRRTAMKIHAKGDSYQVQVGHTKMKPEEIFENTMEIIDKLSEEFPGGLDNIRSLGIKTSNSITVPIYLTLKYQNDVNVPLAIPKKPRGHKIVSGELTTSLNKKVTVFPSGKVVVNEIPKCELEQSNNEISPTKTVKVEKQKRKARGKNSN